MKTTRLSFLFFIFFFSILNGKPLQFNKVILWGHKLHSHTHSYIHWGFQRAFKHLGYEVHWIGNHENVSGIDFSNSLFITEGQVDSNMPLRDDCFYVLHNCTSRRYDEIKKLGNYITLQVYTHDCIPRNVTYLDKFMCYDLDDRVIYLPWATDLLPHEIDEMKRQVPEQKKSRASYFVGSVCGGIHGNFNAITQFKKGCEENGIRFVAPRHLSMEKNINVIQESFIAPTLQGPWQCQHGYIPCRIFKNISYGQWGITNSKTVYELFDKKIIYDSDPYELFYKAKEHIENADIQELYDLMDVVKNKHTYLNRIKDILNFFELVLEK